MSTSPPANPNREEKPSRGEKKTKTKQKRKDNSAFEKSVILALKLQRLVDFRDQFISTCQILFFVVIISSSFK